MSSTAADTAAATPAAPAPTVTSTATSAATGPDAAARTRVERLLARAPAQARGRTRLDGRDIDYRIEAAFLPVHGTGLDGAAAEPEAAVFTTAWLQDAPAGADLSRRPVMFAFNGGPGSASVWLQFGALGPQRVRIHDDGTLPPPPHALEDNPHSWFGLADLVFIDPPHTGYSTTAGEAARKRALSVDGDVAMLAEVVQQWLSRHRRWGSPVYLAGESYGTTRGAALADVLIEAGVALSGLVLVSCAMDLQALDFRPRNDLPYALFLPAFAGVAQYHGLLKGPAAASPERARALATDFVEADYLRVLHRGARAGADERRRVQRRIAELTGLPPALVEQRDLRIDDATFFVEALRPRGQVVGRLEARVTAPQGLRQTTAMEFDPGIEALVGPYTMAARQFHVGTLGLDPTERYLVMSGDTHKAWNWNRGQEQGGGFCCTSTDLARAMRRNPHLRVFVASGHYDLGTPSTASDWSLEQLGLPAEVAARITHRHYDAGHMMYTRESDLAQLRQDLTAWVATVPVRI